MPSLQALQQLGQSVWLDHIDRAVLESGELASLVNDGLTGVTSNPTIFAKAIDGSGQYDAAIRGMGAGLTPEQAASRIMVEDIQAAADVLAPVHQATGGDDGFVSLEVPPALAYDAAATVGAVRTLWREVARPNVMIKVPGTEAGVSAMETLLTEGIHVNVTLLFSVDRYRHVLEAYIRAMAANPTPRTVRSVASFFVSRVDGKLDPLLAQLGTEQALALQGRAAIANAGRAYGLYRDMHAGAAFQEEAERGAQPQKLLWASTSTKDPNYSDVMYVDSLIGAGTVNTMNPATLAAWRDHGTAQSRLEQGGADHEQVWEALRRLNLPLNDLMEALEREGVETFQASYETLVRAVGAKLRQMSQ